MKTPAPFLDADQIRSATFVRHVEIHDELGSTNARAAELARDATAELPVLVVARRQTAGRGRGEHTWWSADGALTFSLLLDTAVFGIDTRDWPRLSLAMGVAVCDAFALELKRAGSSPRPRESTEADAARDKDIGRELGGEDAPARLLIGVKWPNDVMLTDRKTCGILIESPGGAAPAKGRLVVGIGINVNNSWQSAPSEAGARGIALCDVTHRPHSMQNMLQNVLNAIHERIEQLAANSPELPADWRRLGWLTGRRVEIDSGNSTVGGVCRGVDEDGSLLLENGPTMQRVQSGSVRTL